MPKYMTISISLTAALCLFWLAGFMAFGVHLKGLPSAGASRTDAIIVLTGGPDRINTGLDLLEAGQAGFLFISGVNAQVTIEKLVSLWRPETQEPPCCVVLGHAARNTAGNAAEAREWISSNNIRSARLLTADYHMPRASLEFRYALPGIEIVPHPVQSHRTNWPLIFQEYNKTLLTLLKLSVS